ncbi:TPA: hypothetical protein DCF80_02985 [Candidatus Saccharibacteria bacterium]|nr:hypothetical protein [Candidatus Saccharibacteria bacterium]HRK40505.1 hypothetical protein [Candidatus Saccharibacteria bacterium]
MTHYSKYELDARIATFMERKLHQFPELKSERYYIERIDSVKPVEKHRTTIRSQAIPARARYALAA